MQFTYRVTGTYEATVTLDIDEVEDFDAEQALSDLVTGCRGGTLQWGSAESEVEESPAGFEDVEAVIGREAALQAYSALSAAGYDVY